MLIKQTQKISTKTMVLCAILTALVFLLQSLGAFVRFGPFSISLVLVPIVIGAATCGEVAGAWLGLIFGVSVLLSGDAGLFFGVNAIGTVITVILKGMFCGYAAGLTYSALSKINKTFATVASAVVCPVVNTGVFLLGCLVFFLDTIKIWTEEAGLGSNVAYYMIFILVGANFLFEIATNMLLSPIIVRVLNVKNKQM